MQQNVHPVRPQSRGRVLGSRGRGGRKQREQERIHSSRQAEGKAGRRGMVGGSGREKASIRATAFPQYNRILVLGGVGPMRQ